MSDHLYAIVDIGSNGIRFSISNLASAQARIFPCLFQDRAAISLFDSIQDPHSHSNNKSQLIRHTSQHKLPSTSNSNAASDNESHRGSTSTTSEDIGTGYIHGYNSSATSQTPTDSAFNTDANSPAGPLYAGSHSSCKSHISPETIADVVSALARFQVICHDFGVPPQHVEVIATEALREAPNTSELRQAIMSKTGWTLTLLSRSDEARSGAFGVASSFHRVNGLFLEIGGGSVQLSWITCSPTGELEQSPTPASLPYGAAALTRRLARYTTGSNSVSHKKKRHPGTASVGTSGSESREHSHKATDPSSAIYANPYFASLSAANSSSAASTPAASASASLVTSPTALSPSNSPSMPSTPHHLDAADADVDLLDSADNSPLRQHHGHSKSNKSTIKAAVTAAAAAANAASSNPLTAGYDALLAELVSQLSTAIQSIGLPSRLQEELKAAGGLKLYVCGGGFRGLGNLLLSTRHPEYPLPIINGFHCTPDELLSLGDHYAKTPSKGTTIDANGLVKPSKKIFRISERRSQQLPAVQLLLRAAIQAFPPIRKVLFSQGGVREGLLYQQLPDLVKAQDPLLVATRPYAPVLAPKYLALLKSAISTKSWDTTGEADELSDTHTADNDSSSVLDLLPSRISSDSRGASTATLTPDQFPTWRSLAGRRQSSSSSASAAALALHTISPYIKVPSVISQRIAPALVNVTFAHSSYPKELQPSAALSIACTGLVSGSHGLSHQVRALLGLALCQRWGGELSSTMLRDQLISTVHPRVHAWWAMYLGCVMHVIGGVHPGGSVHSSIMSMKLSPVPNEPRKLILDLRLLDNNEMVCAPTVRSRILSLEKRLHKLSKMFAKQDSYQVSVNVLWT